MVLLLAVMFSGTPGIYIRKRGLMFLSDNFCTKAALATLFILSTIPTWVVLTCSVTLEKTKSRKRWWLLFIMALPVSTGLGIVFFSLCTTPILHYLYVNVFAISVGSVHLVVALTARHTEFYQSYYVLLLGSAICTLAFILFARIATGPGTARNTAVVMEYLATIGFIFLNGLSADRISEHIHNTETEN